MGRGMDVQEHPGRRRGPRPSLWVALGASVALHLLLVNAVQRLPVAPPPPPPRREPITITFQKIPPQPATSTVADPNTPHAPSSRAPRPPPVEEKREDPRPDGQVVRLPPPKVAQKPDEARYLSEFDRKVQQETRARKTSNKAPPAEEFVDEENAPAEKQEVPSEESAPEGGRSGTTAASQLALRLNRLGTTEEQYAGGGLMEMWRAAERGQRGTVAGAMGADEEEQAGGELPDDEGAEGTGGEGEGAGPSGPVELSLSPSAASRIAGGAPANDALDEIPEGAGTLLNSKQWKYAAFFNRVSDAIRRHWRPNDALRSQRDDPRLQRAHKRTTTVELTLDRQGRVVRVVVERYCGLPDLDEEAVRAARAAGPFPNPPEGLFEGKDVFTFRFGFQVSFERERGPMMFAPGAFGR
ncbi:MAG: TonB family protein [Myxococcota bacterium]